MAKVSEIILEFVFSHTYEENMVIKKYPDLYSVGDALMLSERE